MARVFMSCFAIKYVCKHCDVLPAVLYQELLYPLARNAVHLSVGEAQKDGDQQA